MMLRNNLSQGVFFLFFLILISPAALAQDIQENLSDFSELKVYNGVKVEVHPSGENRISITGHSKEKVKYEIVENRLEIKLSLENIWSEDNTLIKVFARDLETIDANESSIIEVVEPLKGNYLTFRSQEGAAIYAPVETKRASVKAVTGGLVQLRGKSDRLDVEVNTGGKYFGEQLKSREAEVESGTGAQSYVYASEYLKATAKLGGTIEIFGSPARLDRKTTLGGKISKKN